MNKTNSLMNEETTNSSLRTGSQSTISDLPTISQLTVNEKIMVENESGTSNTTIGDIITLASGGVDPTLYALKTDVDAKDAELQTNIDAITNAPLTPDADVLRTEEILSRKADGTITTINQSVLAGSGGGVDLTPYALKTDVDAKDAELQTNIDAITNAPLTPDADVLRTEEILSRKADGTITTINQSVLAGSGGGVDLTPYALKTDVDAKDAELQTSTDTNTANIIALDARVTAVEGGGTGGGGFVDPFHIAITSTDIDSADRSITIDLSAHIDQKSFCIDIDILDTEAIFIINIIGTGALNGFLEELYLRGNIGFTNTSDTKMTSLYIEGVKKTDIPARVLHYGIKCRCTINQISDIFYYAKFDENGDYIDAIFSNKVAASTNTVDIIHPTDTFFFAFEPVTKADDLDLDTTPMLSQNLAYIDILNVDLITSRVIRIPLDVSLLIVDSYCKANGDITEKIYAQDNVQDYLMFYGRTAYLPNIYFPRYRSVPSNDPVDVSKELLDTTLLYTCYKAISGNETIALALYSVTAIGRFGKLLDMRNLPQ